MHVRDARVYSFCEQLYPLIAGSSVFVAEMDLNARDAPPPVRPYDMLSFFGIKRFQKIRHQILKSFAVDIQPLAEQHPLLIITSISQSMMAEEHHVSLDEHLWTYAQSKGLRTQGLESFEEQFDLLHRLDPVPLYKQIRKISAHPARLRAHTARTVEIYMQGNVRRLYQYSKSSMQQLRKTVIYQRNRNMAERIMDFGPESHFIAVGAGHLAGKFGLIALLKHKGYNLTPIPLSQ
jgi:uncharacterized protein YbaP (TraB family)